MAFDLSKIDPQSGSTPDPSFRRETTAPRVSTDRPAFEVNQTIRRPDMSGAEQLQRILGLASDVAQNIAGDVVANKNAKDSASAEADFAAGTKNDKLFSKSRAYHAAWSIEGAKAAVTQIGTEAAQAVQDLFNDPDNPPTPQEVQATIDGVYKKHILDPSGKPLDFGVPAAQALVGQSLSRARNQLLEQALPKIKEATDGKLIKTTAFNAFNDALGKLGAPLNDNPAAPPTVDPLAPLPEPEVDAYTGHSSSTGLRAPFSGFSSKNVSSRMGAPREGGSKHSGEDFPTPSGTPIVAPLDGEVISSNSSARGGNQVRVRLSNGAIVGFAHLSSRGVKAGDQVTAGQQLGLSGATGHATGPHVHMTVEVGGKKVSPSAYFAGAVADGTAQAAATVDVPTNPVPAKEAVKRAPVIDFEAAMAALPKTIDRGEAKKSLLRSFINAAADKGDPRVLEGLEFSERKDGTPSFSPEEVSTILEARQAIANKAEAEADKAKRKAWSDNADKFMAAFVDGSTPSKASIRAAMHRGEIDPSFGFTLINHIDSEARSLAAQARQEARLAQAEEDADTDASIAGMVAERQTGVLHDAEPDDDLKLWRSGALGTGKKSVARLRTLRAAAHAGEQIVLSQPDVRTWGARLKQNFGVRTMPTGPGAQADPLGFNLGRPNPNYNPVAYAAMQAAYLANVKGGMDPAAAYLKAVSDYGPKAGAGAALTAQARRQRIAELQARQNGGR